MTDERITYHIRALAVNIFYANIGQTHVKTHWTMTLGSSKLKSG